MVGCVFVAAGIWMISHGNSMGWAVAIFFALGLPVFVTRLLPNANYLKLDKKGFEICSLYKTGFYNWKDVEDFTIKSVKNNRMVFFEFTEEYQENNDTARKVAAAVSGSEGALPDNYGLSAKELMDLMISYKEEAAK